VAVRLCLLFFYGDPGFQRNICNANKFNNYIMGALNNYSKFTGSQFSFFDLKVQSDFPEVFSGIHELKGLLNMFHALITLPDMGSDACLFYKGHILPELFS